MLKRTSLLILILIILVGSFLRIRALNTQSIWVDEMFGTLKEYPDIPGANSVSEILTRTKYSDLHPPFYYIFMFFWVKIFGLSEVALRLPSFFFWLAAVFMVYKIGKTLFDDEIALLSCLIFSLQPFSIYYSIEARMYSLMFFLSALATYFFIKVIINEKNRNTVDWILYAVFSFIGMSTHYFFFLIILSHFIYLVINKRNLIRKWLIFITVTSVLYIPFLISAIHQYYYIIRTHLVSFSVSFLFQMFSNFIGINNISLKYAFIYFCFYIFILIQGIKENFKSRVKLLLLYLFFIPISAAVIFSIFTSVLRIRDMSIIFPYFCIILAAGLCSTLRKNKVIIGSLRERNMKKVKFVNKNVILIYNIILIFFYVAFLTLTIMSLNHYEYYMSTKLDWRSASKFLNSADLQNRLVVVTDNALNLPITYYKPNISFIMTNDFNEINLNMKNHTYLLFITSKQFPEEINLSKKIESEYTYLNKTDFNRLCIYTYMKK